MQSYDNKEQSLLEQAYGTAFAELTFPEQRLITLSLATSADDISDNQLYWVSREDMVREGGISPHAKFKDLEAIAEALFTRAIDVKPAPGIIHHIWWLSDIKRDVLKNRVGLRYSFSLANFFNRNRYASMTQTIV